MKRRISANEFRDRDASPPKGDKEQPASSDLDSEIEGLRRQAEALKTELQVQLSTLLSSDPTLKSLEEESKRKGRQVGSFATLARAQEAYNQQCLYRTCAGITTFKVKDPDPNAVDGGAVLGVRIEVMSRAKFMLPYYVMLNRRYAGEVGRRYLAVHRHTVPACIPLAGLAARYLPGPPGQQDLARFARALRAEVVRYHNRMAVVADLRKAVGLGRPTAGIDAHEKAFTDISPADAEMKQITLQWDDGRTGRLVMDDHGMVEGLVVYGHGGRDGEAARKLLGVGGSIRVEEVAKRLAAPNHVPET